MKRAAAARRMPPKRLTGTEEAARRGLPLGQYDLGCLYEAGQGVPRDRRKALELFRQAAQEVPEARQAVRRLEKAGEPNGSWAGCWWPMPCSWEQDYGRAAPVTGSSGWRQWPLRRWPEGAVCTMATVWCRR